MSAKNGAARFQLFFQARADNIAQLENGFVGNFVKRIQTFLAARNDCRVKHHAEMFGNIRLSRAGRFDQIGDIHLFVAERVQ